MFHDHCEPWTLTQIRKFSNPLHFLPPVLPIFGNMPDGGNARGKIPTSPLEYSPPLYKLRDLKKFQTLPPVYRSWDLEKFRPLPYRGDLGFFRSLPSIIICYGTWKNARFSVKFWVLFLYRGLGTERILMSVGEASSEASCKPSHSYISQYETLKNFEPWRREASYSHLHISICLHTSFIYFSHYFLRRILNLHWYMRYAWLWRYETWSLFFGLSKKFSHGYECVFGLGVGVSQIFVSSFWCRGLEKKFPRKDIFPRNFHGKTFSWKVLRMGPLPDWDLENFRTPFLI